MNLTTTENTVNH